MSGIDEARYVLRAMLMAMPARDRRHGHVRPDEADRAARCEGGFEHMGRVAAASARGIERRLRAARHEQLASDLARSALQPTRHARAARCRRVEGSGVWPRRQRHVCAAHVHQRCNQSADFADARRSVRLRPDAGGSLRAADPAGPAAIVGVEAPREPAPGGRAARLRVRLTSDAGRRRRDRALLLLRVALERAAQFFGRIDLGGTAAAAGRLGQRRGRSARRRGRAARRRR